MSALNVMVIRVQRHANISKEATLLDGLDVSPLKYLRKIQVKIKFKLHPYILLFMAVLYWLRQAYACSSSVRII